MWKSERKTNKNQKEAVTKRQNMIYCQSKIWNYCMQFIHPTKTNFQTNLYDSNTGNPLLAQISLQISLQNILATTTKFQHFDKTSWERENRSVLTKNKSCTPKN